jgi:hypothetical protein
MITTKVVIQMPTHAAVVTVLASGTIQVFKYTDANCDWETFQNQLAASDYITEPLPTNYMRVVVEGDSSTLGPI